jgi:hypothetical protein
LEEVTDLFLYELGEFKLSGGVHTANVLSSIEYSMSWVQGMPWKWYICPMKTYLRIIRLVKPYWGYAVLNVAFNMCSVVFNLFSLTMVAPFLDLLFLKSEADYAQRIAKGAPELTLSVDALVDGFYYYFTSIIGILPCFSSHQSAMEW